ncbi:hypothetical protein BDF14DRAFT_1314999 [Spinellus fusiger]|nr:hypothetical protein BDF14DRAFT_1314999 [Spinellus fusiger]
MNSTPPCSTMPHNISIKKSLQKSSLPMHTEEKFAAMLIDEDEDDDLDDLDDLDDDSSFDEAGNTQSAQQSGDEYPKPRSNQALFLNFTSDLCPQKTNKKKMKPKKQTAYKVNGVNILNRNNLDSKTAIERIQRRRENHNHVERRRRDNINSTILELSRVVPNALQPGQKPNKGNILRLALDYIKDLQMDNQRLKSQMNSSIASGYHSQKVSSPTHYPTEIKEDRRSTTNSVPKPKASLLHYQQKSMSHKKHSLTATTASISPVPSAPNSPILRFSHVVFPQNHSSPSSPIHLSTTSPSLSISNQHDEIHLAASHQPPPLTLPAQLNFHHHTSMNVHSHGISSTTTSPLLSPYSAQQPVTHAYTSHSTGTPSSPYFVPQNQYAIAVPPVTTELELETSSTKNLSGLSLRPLLPAQNNYPQPTPQQLPTRYLPSLRMSGFEKMYGNVCRY